MNNVFAKTRGIFIRFVQRKQKKYMSYIYLSTIDRIGGSALTFSEISKYIFLFLISHGVTRPKTWAQLYQRWLN